MKKSEFRIFNLIKKIILSLKFFPAVFFETF